MLPYVLRVSKFGFYRWEHNHWPHLERIGEICARSAARGLVTPHSHKGQSSDSAQAHRWVADHLLQRPSCPWQLHLRSMMGLMALELCTAQISKQAISTLQCFTKHCKAGSSVTSHDARNCSRPVPVNKNLRGDQPVAGEKREKAGNGVQPPTSTHS